MIIIGRMGEEELLQKISRGHGSLVSYFGYVRRLAHGRKVKGMKCEEKENSRKIMEEIEKEIRKLYPVEDVLLYHSVGKVDVGELLAAVLVSTVHRDEGFKACRFGIDEIKKREPLRRMDIFEE